MIVKEGDYFVVRSHTTHRSFGKYKTRDAAEIRLNQIRKFKHKK